MYTRKQVSAALVAIGLLASLGGCFVSKKTEVVDEPRPAVIQERRIEVERPPAVERKEVIIEHHDR